MIQLHNISNCSETPENQLNFYIPTEKSEMTPIRSFTLGLEQQIRLDNISHDSSKIYGQMIQFQLDEATEEGMKKEVEKFKSLLKSDNEEYEMEESIVQRSGKYVTSGVLSNIKEEVEDGGSYLLNSDNRPEGNDLFGSALKKQSVGARHVESINDVSMIQSKNIRHAESQTQLHRVDGECQVAAANKQAECQTDVIKNIDCQTDCEFVKADASTQYCLLGRQQSMMTEQTIRMEYGTLTDAIETSRKDNHTKDMQTNKTLELTSADEAYSNQKQELETVKRQYASILASKTEKIEYVREPSPYLLSQLRTFILQQLQFEQFTIKILSKCDHFSQINATRNARVKPDYELVDTFKCLQERVRKMEWGQNMSLEGMMRERQENEAKCRKLIQNIYWRCKQPVSRLLGRTEGLVGANKATG